MKIGMWMGYIRFLGWDIEITYQWDISHHRSYFPYDSNNITSQSHITIIYWDMIYWDMWSQWDISWYIPIPYPIYSITPWEIHGFSRSTFRSVPPCKNFTIASSPTSPLSRLGRGSGGDQELVTFFRCLKCKTDFHTLEWLEIFMGYRQWDKLFHGNYSIFHGIN